MFRLSNCTISNFSTVANGFNYNYSCRWEHAAAHLISPDINLLHLTNSNSSPLRVQVGTNEHLSRFPAGVADVWICAISAINNWTRFKWAGRRCHWSRRVTLIIVIFHVCRVLIFHLRNIFVPSERCVKILPNGKRSGVDRCICCRQKFMLFSLLGEDCPVAPLPGFTTRVASCVRRFRPVNLTCNWQFISRWRLIYIFPWVGTISWTRWLRGRSRRRRSRMIGGAPAGQL